MIDLFASEYGWTMKTILALPPDQVNALTHAILARRGVRCVRRPGRDDATGTLAERVSAAVDATNKAGRSWQEQD